MNRVQYHAMNFDDAAGYDALKKKLAEIERKFGTQGNRLFYLATAPEYFSDIMKFLGEHRHGEAASGDGGNWVRVHHREAVRARPGVGRALNDEVNKVFDEDQIFRIDHYLGKETVQNILVFRFANGIFENVWNRNYIDHVRDYGGGERSASRAAGRSTRRPARCATWCRTT